MEMIKHLSLREKTVSDDLNTPQFQLRWKGRPMWAKYYMISNICYGSNLSFNWFIPALKYGSITGRFFWIIALLKQ
jgi:hypothetical protein